MRILEHVRHVEHDGLLVPGREPEHDVDEPVGLHVDAGANLLERATKRPGPLLEQLVHVRGPGLAGQAEADVPERLEGVAFAPLDVAPRPPPLPYDLVER